MWFERQLKKDEIPKLSNVIEFLKDHAMTLQHSKPNRNKYQKSSLIKTYRLCTVTYGTASASYLATRVLKQLAIDEHSNFPKASEVLLHNCYIDDVLFGADILKEAEKLIPELQ
ncbi:hypothetical protein AVEN_229900-1 [Araneus ventricosus]|uniref:Reverse transcriptase domain-containing protein n=1 Tax=Araneus ventricosus TaxID=182803 RepID=A0A4Y2U8G7_ARAVE|nr:hypothetical protein AVEN_229900-1 [Araneus ventricosus]